MAKYLFCVIGLIALYLGFGPVAKKKKKYLFQTTTFYLTCLSILIWFWTLIPKTFSKQKITPHIPAFILASLLIATIAWITPHQLRVLYDETNLLGISQALYENRTFYIPTQALFHNHILYIIDYEWGVRPLTFPFFLFLIHLIKGYALSNVFLLNACAGIFSLFIFYLLLQRFFSKYLAILGLCLLAAYPIFALRTTSGGYEILNLGFLIFAFYQLHCALTSQASYHTTRLIFTLILLAQVRYESALFVCTFGPFVVWHCFKILCEIPHKIILLTPILLLPVAWQRILYSGDEAFMVRDGASMFGLDNFLINLEHAFYFFSGHQSAHGTIPLLLYVAIIGATIGLIHTVQNRNAIPTTTKTMLLTAGVTLVSLTGITLSYILSNMTRPIGLRWGIVFLPFIITPIIYFCHLLVNKNATFQIPLFVATGAIIFFAWSSKFQNVSVHTLQLQQTYQAYTAFFKEHDPHKQALIISPYARLFVPDQRSAVTIEYANQYWSDLQSHHQKGMFNDIFLCQTADTKTQTIRPDTRFAHNVPRKLVGALQMGEDTLLIFQLSLSQQP